MSAESKTFCVGSWRLNNPSTTLWRITNKGSYNIDNSSNLRLVKLNYNHKEMEPKVTHRGKY